MKTIVSTIIAVLFCSFANAQTSTKILGTVQDGQGKGINAVSVSLLKAKDSSLAKMAVTDKSGQYEFVNVKEGKYFLAFSSVGFAKQISKAIEVSTNNVVAVPAVTLAEISKELTGVTVQSSKPLVETKIEKMIVNVDASPTNAGATAMDVLEKSPGVTVDKDGNLSLKGKQGVIVLIDGKPSYLGGQDLANLLKNMPANQLDQIEIMTQPSAKYDASGNSGIINLRTKKSKTVGLNGSFNLSFIQAVYPKSPNSFNFNYRKGNINFFSNLSYSYWEGFNDLELNRVNNDTVLKQKSTLHFYGKNYSARMGVDYSVNKTTTLGIVLNGTYNPRNSEVNSNTNTYDQFGQFVSSNSAASKSIDPWKNFGGNLNFRKVLSKTGEEISADFDYVRYISRSDQTSNNYNFSANGSPKGNPYLLKGLIKQDIAIYSGKIDYSLPLKNEAKLEAGLKSSLVSTDNDSPYDSLNYSTMQWVRDPRSDHFKYDENINAAYINYSKQFQKWGIQTGLRLEHTHSVGTQILLGKEITKDLVQLFPSAYISYKMNDKNQFALSYGRRIERPNYQDLNPFQRMLDQFTYQQGNPYLTPQFSRNIELSHNYRGALNTTLNYTTTTDIINDVIRQKMVEDKKVTFQTKENLAKRRNIGLAVSLNMPITKWWTTSFYVNAYNNHYEGMIGTRPLNVDLTSFMMNTSQQFKFAKTWSAEVSGFYRSKSQDAGMIVAEPMGVVSFGASKQILKGKGTLRLNVSDPFYIQKFRGYTVFDDINLHVNNSWDNRCVGLSFTYRFSKGQNAQPQRRRTGSAQDEQNRVGGNQQQ